MNIEDLPSAQYSMISLQSLENAAPVMYAQLPEKQKIKLRQIIDQTLDKILKLTSPTTIIKLQNEAQMELMQKKNLQDLQKE